MIIGAFAAMVYFDKQAARQAHRCVMDPSLCTEDRLGQEAALFGVKVKIAQSRGDDDVVRQLRIRPDMPLDGCGLCPIVPILREICCLLPRL